MQQLRTIEVIDLSDYRKAKSDGKAEGLAQSI